MISLIAVDEESEIHKLSNSQIRLFHKIMNTRKKILNDGLEVIIKQKAASNKIPTPKVQIGYSIAVSIPV